MVRVPGNSSCSIFWGAQGAVQRTHNERLTRRVMFGTMAGGETPRPGGPEKNLAQCLVFGRRVIVRLWRAPQVFATAQQSKSGCHTAEKKAGHVMGDAGGPGRGPARG